MRIAGVNWFGLETPTYSPQGLWVRNYREMLDQIKSLGFNTVRLPFSNQLFETESRPNGIDFGQTLDLEDLTGLEVMDRIIAYAGRIGLKITLDRHRPDLAGQSNLWYTFGTIRRAGGSRTGRCWPPDIKVMPRLSAWICTTSRATRLAGDVEKQVWTGGSAQKAGNAILSVNPNLLVIVEGVELHANSSYWWGGNLTGVADAPVLLDVANAIVYSAHDYPGFHLSAAMVQQYGKIRATCLRCGIQLGLHRA